jgi:formate hydrogenlyase subunit 6/NADH:ubiquinone oxidoreductase subunit I
LIAALARRGYRVVGPRARDGAIVYGEVASAADLPIGWRDEQAPGRYRLSKRDDAAVFGFVVGPDSPKRFLHVPVERLFQLRRKDRGFEPVPQPKPGGKTAILGARACEIAAIGVQDRVLIGGDYADPRYAARRDDLLIVAVSCGEPGASCFCASMNTGPRPREGFDLSLTEIAPADPEAHRFLIEVGSEVGAAIADELALAPAPGADLSEADAIAEQAAQHMGRRLDTDGIRDLLLGNPEHPRWDDVAQRCLSCTNCTMVCPTCFCTRVDDHTDLSGDTAERVKRWDSCFSLDYSYMHGGEVRSSTRARYRQWLTHKLASWFDQFDESGCVGCGRCITWCPAGIDITEEVAAIRRGEQERTAS